MPEKPLVSVVIPTKDRRGMLKKSLQSIYDQTYKDLEVIVIDDGSTDGTEEMMRHLDDDRLRYHRNAEPAGGMAARLKGVEMANGKYIAFLDDDDVWLPEKIERQVTVMEGQPNLGAVSCWYLVDTDGYISKRRQPLEINYKDLLTKNHIGSFSTCMSTSNLAKKFNFSNTAIPAAHDWIFWLKIVKEYKVQVVPEFLVIYNNGFHGRISNAYRNQIIARRYFLEHFRHDMDELQKRQQLYAIEFFKLKDETGIRKKFLCFFPVLRYGGTRGMVMFVDEIVQSLFPFLRGAFFRKMRWRLMSGLREIGIFRRWFDSIVP